MSRHSHWFVSPAPRPGAAALLFCLPYAGGGASAFHGWAADADPRIEVLSVVLPGRESRFLERAAIDVVELADAIHARADRPYAIYGHSMGGRLGFEVVRELRRRGERQPVGLYLGGCRPPDLAEPLARLARTGDEELLARLAELGGIPDEVMAEPELRDLVLPVLRADFTWIDGYTYRPEPPIEVPIVAFAGEADPAVPAADIRQWERHTTGAFRLHVEPGDHFFLHTSRARILQEIRADLFPADLFPADPLPADLLPAEADRTDPVAGHLVPLGDTGWSVWRDVVLRSTGFPADGLDRFAAPYCAQAADELLAGDAGEEQFDKAFGQALADGAAQACQVAADPLFREAVTWQNRNMLVTLDALVRGGPGQSRNRPRRVRELAVAKYWQRYCAKNETIGFFGPVAWADLDPRGQVADVRIGPGLARRRRTDLEDWALRAYAARLAEDPRIRRSLPPALQPHLVLDGRQVSRPAQPPVPVSAAEAALLARSDGRRSAAEVVAEVVGDAGIRTADDAYLLLDRLAERGLLAWHGELPQSPDAERELRQLLTGIEEPDVRTEAVAGLDRLCAARDAVAAAAGDPDALLVALETLDAEFTAVTGLSAQRRAGQTYAGRGLVYEDTVRDVQVTFGGPLLDVLADPLALLLGAARWLTAELAAAYGAALRELYEELRADAAEVRLADVWYLAQGLLFGSGDRPVDTVARELAERWAKLFGLADVPEGTAELRFTAAELAAAAASAFPAVAPGWSVGRLHSPDLQICADSVEALERGDYLVVLGELHAAWPTFDCAVFTRTHPDPEALRTALAADVGRHRIRPLYPIDWPRLTGRMAHSLDGPTDRQLGWTAAPGVDPDRLLPAAAVLVTEVDGELVAQDPGGRRWPLIEMFSELVSMHAVDGFKLTAAAPHGHTPRIVIDRMVVARRTWRTTTGATGLADASGERAAYLAVRRWRRELGLPERVFVKLSTEIKPSYVDLTSPLYASLFCAMVRKAHLAEGPDVRLVVTEMLPTPDQAWLSDAEGRRYFTELRMHAVDPVPAPFTAAGGSV
ncbi:thioesterase domain-containing protein [Microtetraspora sp. NBRC 16547]|uniref:thioesterase domain-containing protein n=1 Tax=Microtetraspora sp. NBRC 16547 TaxID=3030993 RepID=UPI0024A6021D|nr:thioesterase domain-containing protein [Microtetraspora sp. NBRC 16547]GLX00438.1 hypothetical protein Misp02_45240 [Microtetraspora sp. NBRC 16547]